MSQPVYHFRIAFKTKSLLKPQPHPNQPQVSGYLHYYFHRSKIIKQFIEITNANIRLVDLKMIKTAFYRNNYQFYQSHLPDLISNQNQIARHELTKQQIAIINQVFQRSTKTIKSQYALLAGSNISGAKSDGAKSPIRCFDDHYENINLTNVFDHYHYQADQSDCLANVKETIDLDYLVKHQQILPNFATYFYQSNPKYNPYYIANSHRFYFPEHQNATIANFNDAQKIANIKAKLRTFYTQNVDQALNKQLIASQNCACPTNVPLERAHIIDFSNLVAKQQYHSAIDPFNCLILCKNCHGKFDHPDYYLQPISLKANLTSQQINYLEQSNKAYQINQDLPKPKSQSHSK